MAEVSVGTILRDNDPRNSGREVKVIRIQEVAYGGGSNWFAIYQAATTALNVEQQTLLMEIMRIADEAAVAAASGSAAPAAGAHGP